MAITKHVALVSCVFLIALSFRLQNFFLPPVDAHAMRQTDTESVTYYFAKADGNPLHPKASLIRPQTNIHGYFFLEFPAYQFIMSLFYRVFGASFIVARIFNLALFGLSFALLYKITTQLFSKSIGLWTVIMYSFIPSSMFFFGHAIHPDLFAMSCVLASIFLLIQQKRNLLISLAATLCMALAVGTRPFILMALPSLFVSLYLRKGKWWEYVILAVGSISIYAFWTIWQKQFPEADHSWQFWTLGGREALYTFQGWKHLIWRNVSGEVIGRIVSGLAGVGILIIGITKIKHVTKIVSTWWKYPEKLSVQVKIFFFCLPWLAAVPIYWWIAPAGNAAHQYYANVFVLPIILCAAFGTNFLVQLIKNEKIHIVLSLFLFAGIVYNGFRTSSYFYHDIVPSHHLEIAKDIEKVVPVGEKIVYLAVNNSVPFSLAHRQGWMLGDRPTDVGSNAEQVLGMKQYGARYFVYAKNNYDLSNAELAKVAAASELVYESDQVKIYHSK